MLEAWDGAGTKFSTMYTMRSNPINKVIKKYIDEGELGKIRRVDMVCTKWLRTQKYFDCQAWRGTWKGEGGGLLMNQAPHNLDLLFWWFGEAESVNAEVACRFHKIETEDEVNALINTKAGFPVRFYANTAEAPGIDRIEIVGERGTLIKENDKLRFEGLKENLEEVVSKSEEAFATIESVSEDVAIPEAPKGHKVVFESFIENILSGAANSDMVAPGNEGIHAVEWANAILLSSMSQRKITLPLERAKYNELLDSFRSEKIKLSR
jgi:predicted dehydrogenase